MAEFEEAVEAARSALERRAACRRRGKAARVAYREAGHALVSVSLTNTHPVHKISIIPRGVGALGYVLSRPDKDRYLITQKELESKIKVALGGTLAGIGLEEISNGATGDLEQVSRIARSMVKEFGMSRLGRVNFHGRSGPMFLANGDGDGDRQYSERTAREIDVEVHKIIDDATNEVREVLGAAGRPGSRGAAGSWKKRSWMGRSCGR